MEAVLVCVFADPNFIYLLFESFLLHKTRFYLLFVKTGLYKIKKNHVMLH